MKRRIITILFILALCMIQVFPVAAEPVGNNEKNETNLEESILPEDAETETETTSIIETGSCGETVTYELNRETGLLTISGQGSINDYFPLNSPFFESSDIQEIIIEEGVTRIGDRAFHSCFSLEKITLPDSLTSIGDWALCDCEAIRSIQIPDSVEDIGRGAFASCECLREIKLPQGMTTVKEETFGGCSSLTEITIPDGVTAIETRAFGDCFELRNVEIPDGVVSIGDQVFWNCYALRSIYFPDSVTEMGDGVFARCKRLTSVRLPDGLESIGRTMFSNCQSLAYIDIPGSVTTIAERAFQDCDSLTSLVLPDSLTTIDEYAFVYSNSLQSIFLPENLSRIGKNAFDRTVIAGIDVYYDGTADQWSQINIDESNLEYFKEPIHFREDFLISAESLDMLTRHSVRLRCYGLTDESVVISWSSSNPKVAAVDSKGEVTALTRGQAMITASVAADGETIEKTCHVQVRYCDVYDDKEYYYVPVYWAADKGITNGYGNVYFGTDENCTREQMVTFLWRQAGKPAPKRKTCPFSDVTAGTYYYKAVLWAYEKGITKGYSSGEYAGKFGVGLSVTREDTVTFIYRMAGKPPVTDDDLKNYKFSDEVDGAYYCKPIAWAHKNGIAKGYKSGRYAGLFCVGYPVLRQDIVTFVYRYANLKSL